MMIIVLMIMIIMMIRLLLLMWLLERPRAEADRETEESLIDDNGGDDIDYGYDDDGSG